MTTILTTLLVGSHFVPPAKTILEHLPVGAPLVLEAEPDNPYDAGAIRVLVRPSAVPESQHDELRVKLPGTGQDWDELLAADELLVLGHIASSEGKPLAVANSQGAQYVGTAEFGALLQELRSDLEVSLGWDGSGKALVHAQFEG